ncbi:carbohydrate binding protein with CBM9 domain [Kribbella pratensis]|uniref:Carbohydrate binding protein with CBM9 domain n=1 Tax=Kribbella pratensis TaxID=2512112 RepID=A0ABY2FBD7_9ACTN|nr:PIG-L family deacetylase [Kribbella pratensis]TDW87808.1 carbohydrate binding protein with CBM9 domain [Kribbella pratensis]
MKRFAGFVMLVLLAALPVPAVATSQTTQPYVADRQTKIDVMGEWAHPDDDTSIIGPCGVWHQQYGVKCGVIMVTRGEGGGNATGPELGPELGLRRENEDRVAHYRSGTVDIFNLDRIDFFYNQSAPLTQYFWDEQETLRRVTRVIRETQPEIYIGFTPTLAAGHGNHQQAGRLIWEGVLAAADPNMFPEQLKGPDALSTWQVKKVFSGGATAGTGGTTTSANCTTGFTPTGLDTVAGVWTGYNSPYTWPAGNTQGQTAGTPKIWQQVADEGRAAYPTQSRVMYKGTSVPACPRFGMTESFVPFQPNSNAAAGRDDAILFGATKPDPGGLPLGTLEYLTFERFYNVAGEPFEATVHLRGKLAKGNVALTVPAGWSTDGPKPVSKGSSADITFTVTPAATATVDQNAKVSALYTTTDHATGYTENVVRIVSAAEGRFQRWGNWQEYDEWLRNTAPQANRLGRSQAIQSMGIGQTIDVPVVVHNWSAEQQTGAVSLDLPANFTVDAQAKPYDLAPGADATVTFKLTNTDTTLPAQQNVGIPIRTATGSETLTLTLVPTTVIQQATPVVDGKANPGEYPGPTLDLGRIWQGASTCTGVDDCGVSSTGEGNTAKVSWSGDALYFFIHVRDDYQSYAVTPAECVGHWQADSVEILLDPRGTASQDLKDTANTFKLGIFPFSQSGGPCWERDADNHQGYSSGALDTGNAPGVQVASTAQWVGSNQTTVPHAYAGGGYDLEVKIPLADLPSAVDPARLGLNITPYDNDDTSAAGTTTLRHIDMSTRLGWSALGSVQSDPYRWGLATLPGYTPPADRPTTPAPPDVSNPNLNGVLSPQTIAQSARNGVPISGRVPTDDLEILSSAVRGDAVHLVTSSKGNGTARAFLTSGELGAILVWTTSCTTDPPPDYGFTPCAITDGATPPWSPDMSGHLVKQATRQVTRGVQHWTIPLTATQQQQLKDRGHLLISYETAKNEVQAFDIRIA